MSRVIEVTVPEREVVRYRIEGDRRISIDFRGIHTPKSSINGRTNPSIGTKRRFLSAEHLQSIVDEYFESCNGPAFDKHGNLLIDENGIVVKRQVKPYTVSGLARYLGMTTEGLRRYKMGHFDSLGVDTDDVLKFSTVVMRARQRIEEYNEMELHTQYGAYGARFVLDCCFGWVGARERAEIQERKSNRRLKRAEFELKQKLLDTDNEDSTITVNIVRKGQEV